MGVFAGQRFGRLTVIDPNARRPLTEGEIARGQSLGTKAALCRCDCGSEITVILTGLTRADLNKATRSCGCWHKEAAKSQQADILTERAKTHSLTKHELYGGHRQMLRRCYNVNHSSYKNYGGRGIQVDEFFHDVRNFIAYCDIVLGKRPVGYTLDRIDNDGNYAPGNIRWADAFMQQANKRPASVS